MKQAISVDLEARGVFAEGWAKSISMSVEQNARVAAEQRAGAAEQRAEEERAAKEAERAAKEAAEQRAKALESKIAELESKLSGNDA